MKSVSEAGGQIGLVLVALPLSYVVWGIVGLNGLVAALRRDVFFYMYMPLFAGFLTVLFCGCLLAKRLERNDGWVLVGYGLVAGFVSAFLALYFMPLLMIDGWYRFLHMPWSWGGLLFSASVIGGWINGALMGLVIGVLRRRSWKQALMLVAVLIVILVVRLVVDPHRVVIDFVPPRLD